MVRLASFSVALACAASVLASGSHAARADAHKKMIKVRDNYVPELSATDLPIPTPATMENIATAGKDTTDTETVKRDDTYRFTFYEAGLGACGETNADTDYTVALNSQQFGNGEHCFKTINIVVNGQTTQATITDECPGCPYGGLDFTPGLFSFFGNLGLGVIYGSWTFA